MRNENAYKGRVALGMSGGVDSSVAAVLLLEAGYDVLGVTCVFSDDAASAAAIADARCTAACVGIEHTVRDCTGDFARCVVAPFVDDYAMGLTPSPCVGCNARVKVPSLIAAADEAGCELVATGHYARIVSRAGRLAIACAADAAKDQSYMLAMLSQEQLARLVLPLGAIAGGKPEVRRIAESRGLPTASKSDSQDICFIGGSHLDFLRERGVPDAPGDIVTLDGVRVGTHRGLHRYTIGQRKGLEIGGAPEPYYVVEKRADTGELVVAFARDALIDAVRVVGMNWQGVSPEALVRRAAAHGPVPYEAKLRYRQRAVSCCVAPTDVAGDMGIAFMSSRGQQFDVAEFDAAVPAALVMLDAPQPATAPGQFCVVYDGDAIAGAGVIETVRRHRRA